MNYEPKCIATWSSQTQGADDMSAYAKRTLEEALTDIERSRQALAEIEQQPMDDWNQMRKSVHEYIVRRRILEARAVQDMRASINKAKGGLG